MSNTAGQWLIEEFTKYDDLDSVRFKMPSGFTLEVTGMARVFDLLYALVERGTFFTSFDTRLFMDDNGEVRVLDTDPWINPDFREPKAICTNLQLSRAALRYLEHKCKN
jgi:hypothetical protein